MCAQTPPLKSPGQKGNALFLILIAVALFAALSYAVTQSGRGSGDISSEQNVLYASQITDFGAAVKTAITRMIVSGPATISTLDFLTTTDSANAVFTSPLGGGIVTVTPPINALQGQGSIGNNLASTFWRYKSTGQVGGNGGWFILGIGTDTSGDASRDAFAFIGVTQGVCTAIDNDLGLTLSGNGTQSMSFLASTPSNEGTALQDGGASTGTSAGVNNNTIAAYPGAAFGCYSNVGGAGPYSVRFTYYHTLIEQ